MEEVNVSTRAEIPGEPTQTSTALLEKATAIQDFGPVNNIHQHLCAFHFYGHDMTTQVDAHQNEEFRQYLIYDRPDDDGRLIGCSISCRKSCFWHYRMRKRGSGTPMSSKSRAACCSCPAFLVRSNGRTWEKVCKTYGKAIHFWQVEEVTLCRLGYHK